MQHLAESGKKMTTMTQIQRRMASLVRISVQFIRCFTQIGVAEPAPQRSPVKETTKKSNRDDKKEDVRAAFVRLIEQTHGQCFLQTHSPVLRKAVPVRSEGTCFFFLPMAHPFIQKQH